MDTRTYKILQYAFLTLAIGFLATKYILKYNDLQTENIELYDGLFRTFLGLGFFMVVQKQKSENNEVKNTISLKILGSVFLISGMIDLISYFLK